MKAGDVTLGHIFAADHHLVVPLFQRPYVWAQEANWTPLWVDVQSAAEAVEAEAASEEGQHDPRTYFLGAVVIQSRRQLPRRLSSSNIIDGQQRLTTLQVLLAAARRVALVLGANTTAGKFGTLIDNKQDAVHSDHAEDLHKLWPLPQDNAAFQWATRTAAAPLPVALTGHKLVQAANWFENRISVWACEADDPEARLAYLFETLRDRMQLVQIFLDTNDDPQVIFEALNHRGVPLDAADLVKNLLFQKVEEQGDHNRADSLLLDSWLPLDGQAWRRQVTTGRLKRSRIDLLLSYWLTIKTGKDVSAEHLFVDVREWLSPQSKEDKDASLLPRASDLIVDIRRYADVYDELDSQPVTTSVGALLDRMQSTGTMTPWPLLLQVYAHVDIPAEQKDLVARAIDSFLMRRGICRMTTADYNKLFVALIDTVRNAEPSEAGHRVIAVMASQTADSRVWPSDEDFRAALTDSALYKSVYRARLKTLLVGLENYLHTGKTESGKMISSIDRGLNIEHLMPQDWAKHWPLGDEHSEEDQLRRATAIHQLGNLTLLTTKLNPSVSNREWTHKRKEIQRHSLLRLTTGSIFSRPDEVSEYDDELWSYFWDEDRIRVRSQHLAAIAIVAWPRHNNDDLAADTLRQSEG